MYYYLPSTTNECLGRLSRTYKAYAILVVMLFSYSQCEGQENAAIKSTETKSAAPSQQPVETESEKQERIASDRFLELLKKRPRTGTALDKVYGYHIQNGSLDKFCESLRMEATEKSSGEAWMLLGMVQMQRGQDAEARVALEKAEELLPKEHWQVTILAKR